MGILLSRCPQPKSRCYHTPIWLWGNREGPAATSQESTHRDATIPVTEALVDEVLSVPETQSDCLSFPNLHATAEEEDEEEEEDEKEEDDEDNEEDDDEDDDKDGNGEVGNPDEGEEREDEKEDDTELDVEVEAEDDPA